MAAPRRVSNHDPGSADPADSMKKTVKKTYALLKASWLWQVLQDVSVPQDVVAIWLFFEGHSSPTVLMHFFSSHDPLRYNILKLGKPYQICNVYIPSWAHAPQTLLRSTRWLPQLCLLVRNMLPLTLAIIIIKTCYTSYKPIYISFVGTSMKLFIETMKKCLIMFDIPFHKK